MLLLPLMALLKGTRDTFVMGSSGRHPGSRWLLKAPASCMLQLKAAGNEELHLPKINFLISFSCSGVKSPCIF